jgi:hypothetical protein
MARRDSTATITPNYTPAWVKVLEWNGLTPGDPVKVSGERGEFTFVAVHETNGEVTDVIVHGGVYGHTTIRAFYPHRVTPKAQKSRKTRQNATTTD